MGSERLTDNEIWSLFKKGDDLALSKIYTENLEKLYLYGLKISSNYLLIEDAIQDLFSVLIKNREKLGPTDNILFYLLKSFRRELKRKIKRENRKLQNVNKEEQHFNVTFSIEHEIINDEIIRQRNELLSLALKELTPRQKEAVYLRFSRELDYREIAEIMEISKEACRNLISSAIKILKNIIRDKKEIISFFF
jgi:RNA polymerase sigma factor (sigma-70 family)